MQKRDMIFWTFLIIAVLTLTFQAVHFVEHGAQATAWVFGYQEKAYMTPLGKWAMEKTAAYFFPNEVGERQSKLGFEMLHFLGNSIFLLGIAALYYFARSKKLLWAYAVQLIHVVEHASLTMSAVLMGKPLGISTMFGLPMGAWSLLAYRIWWHFIFNLIPTVLVALVLYEIYTKVRKK